MSQQEQQASGRRYLCDDLVARAKKGQAAILEDMLKSGIPLTYCDEHGNKMRKNPDGTTTLLEKVGK